MNYSSFEHTFVMNSCPPLDGSGNPVIHWIAHLSGSCVYGNLSALSWVMGCISFVAWLGAQLPQVVMNYTHHSVEGLSLGFLANWFAGDFTNLMGCLLTQQMPFQTVLAAYYVCIDCILGGQYIYYTSKARRRRHRKRKNKNKSSADPSSTSVKSDESSDKAVFGQSSDLDSTRPIEIVRHLHRSHDVSRPQDLDYGISDLPKDDDDTNNEYTEGPAPARSPGLIPLITSSFIASFSRARAAPIPDAQTLTIASTEISTATLGRMFAWICTFMYLTSRIPQILENYRRKSTWGTSLLLFTSALIGNITYTISILTSPQARGATASQFIVNELPYLIGSAGTVCFDLTIFFQFAYYGSEPDTDDSCSDEERAVLLLPEEENQTPEVSSSNQFHRAYPHHHHEHYTHPHHQYPNFSLFPSHVNDSPDSSLVGTPSESLPGSLLSENTPLRSNGFHHYSST